MRRRGHGEMLSCGGTAPSLEAAAAVEAASSSCLTWQRGQRPFP